MARKHNGKMDGVHDHIDEAYSDNEILNESDESKQAAHELVKEANEQEPQPGKAKSIAAGMVYIVNKLYNNGLRQHEVAEIFDVSIQTVRNHYQRLTEVLCKYESSNSANKGDSDEDTADRTETVSIARLDDSRD